VAAPAPTASISFRRRHTRPGSAPTAARRTPDAALSPIAVADAVTGLLDALDLHDVVLVGSDTGGGLCQLALRGD
jgi:pimeloyl-ACP methyl ester carboxylesterase